MSVVWKLGEASFQMVLSVTTSSLTGLPATDSQTFDTYLVFLVSGLDLNALVQRAILNQQRLSICVRGWGMRVRILESVASRSHCLTTVMLALCHHCKYLGSG